MIIERRYVKTVPFNIIKQGETFIHENKVYLKVNTLNFCNCVRLMSGTQCFIEHDINVIPEDYKVVPV